MKELPEEELEPLIDCKGTIKVSFSFTNTSLGTMLIDGVIEVFIYLLHEFGFESDLL